MKKLFLLGGLGLVLGLSSCGKETTINDDGQNQETFVLNGEKFKIGEVQTKMALITGLDEDRFTFVSDSLAFALRNKHTEGYSLLYIKDYIDVIKIID